MESRLMEIEIKLALTEDLVDTLNLTVHRQQGRSMLCSASWWHWPGSCRHPRPRLRRGI
jgi:hypothetical protein